MERQDVKNILSKIKAFRQSFDVTNSLMDEWVKVLAPYRYEDVNKKLDDYFKETNNFGQYPDAYYLTRYLRTEEELENKQDIYARCSICNKPIIYYDLHNHYERCSSIDYIKRCGEKYLHRKFDEEKLWNMNTTTFDELYWKVCEETFKVIPECLEKHTLENAILTHNGKQPKYVIEKLNELLTGE